MQAEGVEGEGVVGEGVEGEAVEGEGVVGEGVVGEGVVVGEGDGGDSGAGDKSSGAPAGPPTTKNYIHLLPRFVFAPPPLLPLAWPLTWVGGGRLSWEPCEGVRCAPWPGGGAGAPRTPRSRWRTPRRSPLRSRWTTPRRRTPPGASSFLGGVVWGRSWVSRLGGCWGWGLGLGAVWGAGRGFEGWGCTGGAHAGGGGGGGLCGHLLAVRRRWGEVANAAPPLDARRENAAAGCNVVHHGREELEHGDGLQVQLPKQRTQIDGPWIASWPTKDHPNGARVQRVDLDVLHLHGR